MTYVGIDLHKRESQVCFIDSEGKVLRELRIPTTQEAFSKAFEGTQEAHVLVESSTISEFVARQLEAMGLRVTVADPNYAPMMGSKRKRKVKTDKRDARALGEACRVGAYHESNRMTDEHRLIRGRIAIRSAVLESRTKLINLVRSQLLQFGIEVASCDADNFVQRAREMQLEKAQAELVAPALSMIETATKSLAGMERKLEALAKANPDARRLATVPGVGVLTALMFVSVIGKAERFQSAAHASAYIGLVPGEDSTGFREHRTRITKTGNSYLRKLLLQCAFSLMRSREGGWLKQWTRAIATRRKSRKLAATALARRLARILWAMLRDGRDFDPELNKERVLEAVLQYRAA